MAVNDVHALLHPEPSSIKWTASIMLPVYPHCKGGGEVNINAAFNTTPPKIDICLYLDKKGNRQLNYTSVLGLILPTSLTIADLYLTRERKP